MTSGWVGSMKLTIFMAPPQRGQIKGSIAAGSSGSVASARAAHW